MKFISSFDSIFRMKQMFTNDIFPESVVAGHAVRVPVTRNLSGDMTGFLPVHCMHQLLKSRVFSKHKVTFKTYSSIIVTGLTNDLVLIWAGE